MAELFKFYHSSPNIKALEKAAEHLKQGALMIYPTDTVYALGCLSNQSEALERLAAIKGVKLEKASFSFFIKDFSELSRYVKPLDNSTFKLIKRCLPGPYTFILPCQKLPKPFDKRKFIGLRMAHHPILDALMEMLDVPLITTSLHDQDEILEYSTDPELIFDRWESRIDFFLDDGFGGNIPSTVVDFSHSIPEVIREGKGSLDLL